MKELTHIDNKTGSVKMVDISDKNITKRFAKASGRISMNKTTLEILLSGKSKKGNVLETARISGIMAAKKNSELIPLCHPIKLNFVGIEFDINKQENYISVSCTIVCIDSTGAEMEALTGVSIACLTIYDMLKAIDREMIISDICLLEKFGGKSGHFIRK